MTYKVRHGVVLFDMAGESFLFPSRSSGIKFNYLVRVSPKLAALLRHAPGVKEADLSKEDKKKLMRFLKNGFVEEF